MDNQSQKLLSKIYSPAIDTNKLSDLGLSTSLNYLEIPIEMDFCAAGYLF